jgi:hypothetical protein
VIVPSLQVVSVTVRTSKPWAEVLEARRRNKTRSIVPPRLGTWKRRYVTFCWSLRIDSFDAEPKLVVDWSWLTYASAVTGTLTSAVEAWAWPV